MGLFSSSSRKNTTNQTQSLSGQAQNGSVYNAAGDVTLLDDGAVRSAIELAEKVTDKATANSDNATALSAEALRIAEKSAAESRDALLKLQEQQARERVVAAQQAQEAARLQAQERAAAAARQEAAAARQTAALQSANKMQAETSQHAIEQNTELSKSAINDLRIFANESLEEVADYGGLALDAVQKTSSDAAKFSNEMSKNAINNVSSNALANQQQMNSVLTNVLTQGQSELQQSASKSMIWVVGLAAVGFLGIAIVGRH